MCKLIGCPEHLNCINKTALLQINSRFAMFFIVTRSKTRRPTTARTELWAITLLYFTLLYTAACCLVHTHSALHFRFCFANPSRNPYTRTTTKQPIGVFIYKYIWPSVSAKKKNPHKRKANVRISRSLFQPFNAAESRYVRETFTYTYYVRSLQGSLWSQLRSRSHLAVANKLSQRKRAVKLPSCSIQYSSSTTALLQEPLANS